MKEKSNMLVCGLNWLGDACMSMPALQYFCSRHPGTRITMLTRPSLTPLWDMHPNVHATIPLRPQLGSMLSAARCAKDCGIETAYVFPNSWRSALVPFFARIPTRIGTRGHHRGILLTKTTRESARAKAGHQQWEYVDILGLGDLQELPPPTLVVPDAAAQAVEALMPSPEMTDWIALIPGAARGPSKQWPQEHFVSAAQQIAENHPCRFVVLGTAGEAPLCDAVAAAIGDRALSLAGKTSLEALIAALDRCATVICNDSGGMHLAASVGTPVAAIYGITDPIKTGPLGPNHQLIRADGVTASRDVPRDSIEAREALQSISPDRVSQAALEILKTRNPERSQ
ncbi:MAG: lipopolysaccharide heptosyltransferase II [Verrucomicrobia bacterium]|nr:lipopolysaccharide heptosyltransferase II [Verrucomicrobiota bacterium]